MEHKTLGGLSVKSTDKGTATAIFSRFGGPPDSDGDITEPSAFTHGQKVPVSAYNHGSWASALPVGIATIRVLPDRAEADIEFFLDTSGGRDTFNTVKALGPLTQYSYGYDVKRSTPGQWNGRPVRILQKLALHEVSPVLVGAGRDTRTVAGSVKSAEDPRLRAELVAIRANLTAGDDRLRDEVRAIKDHLELCAIRDDLARQTRRYWSECAPPAPSTVDVAWKVLGLCCAELGVDLPLLRWFGPETAAERDYAAQHGERDWPAFATDENVRGAWQKGYRTVWIAADLSPRNVIATVAHEVAHAAGGDEDAAQAYEALWFASVANRS